MVSTPRGTDSTGVFGVGHSWKTGHGIYWNREDIPPQDFIDQGYYRGVSEGSKEATMKLLVAHNRAATMGKICKANTHPFNFQNVIGVHNGTIHKTMPNSKEYGTDSEALYRLINDRGIEDALLYLGDNGGVAYALAFYLKKEQKFGLVSNGQRTLTTYVPKNGRTVYFASEHLMLHWILQRNKQRDGAYDHLHEKKHQVFLFDVQKCELDEVLDLSTKMTKTVHRVAPAHSEGGTSSRSFRPGGGFKNGRWLWNDEQESDESPPFAYDPYGQTWGDWEREVRAWDAANGVNNNQSCLLDPAHVQKGEEGTKTATSSGTEAGTETGTSPRIKEVPVETDRPFRPGRTYVRRKDKSWYCIEWGTKVIERKVEDSSTDSEDSSVEDGTESVEASRTPKGKRNSRVKKGKPKAPGPFDHLEDPKFSKKNLSYTGTLYVIEQPIRDFLAQFDKVGDPVFKNSDGRLYSYQELDDLLSKGCGLTGLTPSVEDIILGQDEQGYVIFEGTIVNYTAFPVWLSTTDTQAAMSGTLH